MNFAVIDMVRPRFYVSVDDLRVNSIDRLVSCRRPSYPLALSNAVTVVPT